jgi:phosphoribosylaminoimidazolecarboxamide formyltransferase / IMP cyclohydrolase
LAYKQSSQAISLSFTHRLRKGKRMPTVLLSVWNKTGLSELARVLYEHGWTLIASGGTARALRSSQLPVVEVSEYTGSPEVLGGRVKTLHPAVHAGILARSTSSDLDQIQHLGWDLIDMVVVNLYPFEETAARPGASHEEVIENIDIGGVALIRAAAKNYARVILLCDPDDYQTTLQALSANNVSEEMRRQLAVKGFQTTASYDSAINAYLSGTNVFDLRGYAAQPLRYGENPHQPAELFAYQPGSGPLGGKLLQGKELSYNNLLDLDAAWRAALTFSKPSICIVKHLSPCGIASADQLSQAYSNALVSDPVSAFGGVIASNRSIDRETADRMKDLFIECIIAPGFDEDSIALLARKKNCRLVEMPDTTLEPSFELRSINRGFVKQRMDLGDPAQGQYQVVTQRKPSEQEWQALHFAWKACQHVKSNAIVLAKKEATVGIGGGQPNRVDSVRIAISRAGERARNSVMASDAFFPFPDSIDIAAKAGITAVIQPGGSVRDSESIAAADTAGIAMVFTGIRHFKH